MIETTITCTKNFSIMDYAAIVLKIRFYECKVRFVKGKDKAEGDSILSLSDLKISKDDIIDVRILGKNIDSEPTVLKCLIDIFHGNWKGD